MILAHIFRVLNLPAERCGCGFDTVDTDLLIILDKVRSYFNKPVTINSGCRCSWHNEQVGGSSRSQHLYGRAADIVVKDTKPIDVRNYIESILDGEGGLGHYETFTHIDTRTKGGARWTD